MEDRESGCARSSNFFAEGDARTYSSDDLGQYWTLTLEALPATSMKDRFKCRKLDFMANLRLFAEYLQATGDAKCCCGTAQWLFLSLSWPETPELEYNS